MKKSVLLLAILCGSIIAVKAQLTEAEKNLKTIETDTVVGWKTGIVSSINFAQTALVNWSAGGESSVAFNGMVSAFAKYKNLTSEWNNTLDVGYGLLQQGDKKFIKTDDRFDFIT